MRRYRSLLFQSLCVQREREREIRETERKTKKASLGESKAKS